MDVGGGTGQLAVRLAADGHRVTVLDPSAAMLATCAQRAAEHGQATSDRLTTVQADAEDAATALGAATADAVICHEVLERVAAPAAVLTTLAVVLRPGGTVSLVVANRAWLTLRAARRGDHAEALRLLDDPEVGRAAAIDAQGSATTRAYTAPELRELLAAAGLTVVTEYGLQVVTDQAAAERARPELESAAQAEALQRLERRMAELEPYRSVAERTHLIARRDV